MTPRTPSAPPVLPGYTPERLIGTGGYADVFLYEQHMPNRKVAVKVLVNEALNGATQQRQFTAEANLMARVSTHPYIVSIFHADVSGDGRPFLVMEYYPGDNYLGRARREQFSVAEVLRVGVKIGSAVETAHRAGILHRDIKPANILTSEFRQPGLADFGIASAQEPDADESSGISIPWSPPEAFGSADLTVQADVYSLAATLYHLLAGRSPYEIRGGDNSQLALMSRIERANLPSIGRADVPASLERVLAQAMAKQVQHRPSSAVEFVRQLQGVEAELKLSVTTLELPDDGTNARLRSDDADDDATRVHGVTEIHAQASAAISSVPADPQVFGQPVQRRREGLLAEPEVANTVARPRPEAPAPEAAPEPTGNRRAWMIGGGAVAAIALVVGVVVATGGSDSTSTPTTTEAAIVVIQPGQPDPVVAGPSTLTGATATFTWTAPTAEDGDQYVVERTDATGSKKVSETSITLTDASSSTCVSVKVVRDGQQDSDATRWCVTS